MSRFTPQELADAELDRWIDKCHEAEEKATALGLKRLNEQVAIAERVNKLYIEAQRKYVNNDLMVSWEQVQDMITDLFLIMSGKNGAEANTTMKPNCDAPVKVL